MMKFFPPQIPSLCSRVYTAVWTGCRSLTTAITTCVTTKTEVAVALLPPRLQAAASARRAEMKSEFVARRFHSGCSSLLIGGQMSSFPVSCDWVSWAKLATQSISLRFKQDKNSCSKQSAALTGLREFDVQTFYVSVLENKYKETVKAERQGSVPPAEACRRVVRMFSVFSRACVGSLRELLHSPNTWL